MSSQKKTTETNQHYEIWRQDDNGHKFKMETSLSQEQAKQKVSEYEAKSHKQHYWNSPEDHS